MSSRYGYVWSDSNWWSINTATNCSVFFSGTKPLAIPRLCSHSSEVWNYGTVILQICFVTAMFEEITISPEPAGGTKISNTTTGQGKLFHYTPAQLTRERKPDSAERKCTCIPQATQRHERINKQYMRIYIAQKCPWKTSQNSVLKNKTNQWYLESF